MSGRLYCKLFILLSDYNTTIGSIKIWIIWGSIIERVGETLGLITPNYHVLVLLCELLDSGTCLSVDSWLIQLPSLDFLKLLNCHPTVLTVLRGIKLSTLSSFHFRSLFVLACIKLASDPKPPSFLLSLHCKWSINKVTLTSYFYFCFVLLLHQLVMQYGMFKAKLFIHWFSSRN